MSNLKLYFRTSTEAEIDLSVSVKHKKIKSSVFQALMANVTLTIISPLTEQQQPETEAHVLLKAKEESKRHKIKAAW